MKKLFLAVAAMAAMVFGFSACGGLTEQGDFNYTIGLPEGSSDADANTFSFFIKPYLKENMLKYGMQEDGVWMKISGEKGTCDKKAKSAFQNAVNDFEASELYKENQSVWKGMKIELYRIDHVEVDETTYDWTKTQIDSRTFK